MMTQGSGVQTIEEVGTAADAEEMPGLCRICGGQVPRASDPTSCTTSLCSESCLAKAIIAYWAAQGAEAQVTLQDGYARLGGLRRGRPRI
jgi:hypothetical protein